MRRFLFACAAVVLGLAFTASVQASPGRGHSAGGPAVGSHAPVPTHVDVSRGHTVFPRGHQDIHRPAHYSGSPLTGGYVNPLYPPPGGGLSLICGYAAPAYTYPGYGYPVPTHTHTAACYGLR